jgi:3-mercaptopyruvate sulfurtransferase SseA
MIRATLRDAALIVGLAVGLAVVYNAAFSVKPLPWIRKPIALDTASTDVLLAVIPSKKADTASASPRPLAWQRDTLPLQKRAAEDEKTPPSKQQSTGVPTSPRLPPKNDALPPPDGGGVRAVTYQQVLMLLRNEDVLFMDARRKDEYDGGHIPRAVNVDIQQFELDPTYRSQMMQHLYSLDKRRPVVTYCGGGNCELSHKLADVLRSVGFEHVFIYTGGWNEYSTKPDSPRER